MSAPTFTDFAPLFDFSQWEIAVQAFFCDATQGGGIFVKPPDEHDPNRENWTPANGAVAFFTGRESAIFQRARPRVDLSPVEFSVFQDAKVIDANGRLQQRMFAVPLTLHVITKADYAYHCSFLATVRAIVAQMNPVLSDPATGQPAIATTGLNAFLTTHELSRIEDAGGPAFGGKWTADEGYFLTPLKYNAIFAVRASAWPAGNQTN
jgi:hypothetical protein